MKRIITITILCIGAVAMFAQPALKVDSNSEVGIGIDNPLVSLHINKFEGEVWLGSTRPTGQANARFAFLTDGVGTVNGTVGYAFGHNALFVENKLAAEVIFETSDTERMRIAADGKVGIGTTSPAFTLDVSGTAGKNGTSEFLVASDKRLKKNINEFDGGLKEILALNPVSFQYNGKGGIKNTSETFIGLVAQDYQKVAPYAVRNTLRKEIEIGTREKDTNGKYDHLSSDIYNTLYKGVKEDVVSEKEYLTIDPSPIRFMLVNAVKEQNAQIVELQDENQILRDKIDAIYTMLEDSKSTTQIDAQIEGVNGAASLKQNTPNPFSKSTSISYFLPQDSKGQLSISNLAGQVIKTISLTNGEGNVNLDALNVTAGQYYYSLLVDGQIKETKKMIIN